jgi:hypothetical protein
VIHIGEHALHEVLIAHQSTSTSGCICGWGQLGHSHAAHVVSEISRAQQQ